MMTISQLANMIVHIGAKHIGQCILAESSKLIIISCIANSTVNNVPPVNIFPRAGFHDVKM